MEPERWRQVEQLYHAALEKDASQRAGFLEQACAGNEELRREVESLLAREGEAESFLEAPAMEVAAKELAGEPSMKLGAGTRLGRYELIGLLGSGGMGEVYRARDRQLGREVAIKILPHDQAGDAERRKRFLREARAVSALNHPNIVTLHDISSDGGTDFVVMEYVQGQTLRRLMAPGGLPWPEVCRYGAQIANALGAAHAAGIVHRDVKPANIMVTPEGQAKVLDFGVAKLTERIAPEAETLTQVEVTTPGLVVGTIAYMSPEQTRGEDLDARSDIFSLGSVLYEAATGRAPFQGPSALAIMHEIAAADPVPPSTLRSGVPPEFDRAIGRALAKSRQERYQSAAELGAALQVLAPGASSAALPPKPAQPKWSAWRIAAATIVILLAAAGALAYYRLRFPAGIDSIAVLPFTNASNDPNLEYQADGLTEELINSLTHAPMLKVIARATVFRYKGRTVDPEEIGRELGVRAVLMGRVVRMNDRATVQADLVDTKDGSQLWGRQFNRPIAELPAIHEEIAQQVIGKIQPAAGDRTRNPQRAVNPEAYDLYLQGRRALADMTTPRIRQSMIYFQQAIARDPGYAAAYAGLADSYSYLGILELEAPKDVMPKAKEAALRALEIDNETAAAYTSLGIVQSMYEWDWAGSRKRFEKALELNPGDAYGQHWLGHYFETMGQWQDAQSQMGKALALDPLNPMYGEDFGYDLIMNGRYDEAAQQLRKVTELDPEDAVAHAFLALALEGRGLRAESLAENQRAKEYILNGTWAAGTVAGIFCRFGRPEDARQMLADLNKLEKQHYVAPLQKAAIQIALGQKDEGLRLLTASAEQRDMNLQYLGTDPVFNPVRRDPRFAMVRDKIRLPEAAWSRSPLEK